MSDDEKSSELQESVREEQEKWELGSQQAEEPTNEKKGKKPRKEQAEKGHAPVRKPQTGRLDYKSIVILTLLKVIKKIKTFQIRKLLRDIKEHQNPTDPERKPKGELPELQRQCEELKKIKNSQLKVLIPFLILYEFKDDLTKYWPILRAENVSKESEYNGLLKVALTELQQRDITLDEDAFSRASTEVDSRTHVSGT